MGRYQQQSISVRERLFELALPVSPLDASVHLLWFSLTISRIVRVGNHNYNQTDYIGFARRTNPPSIVGPVVGGVVGSFGGIALITLTIFFWIRCRDQQKIRDVLDSQDQSGDFGRFTENKDAKPFPLTVQPTKAPPISPTSLSHTATSQPPVIDGIP